jgi:transposase
LRRAFFEFGAVALLRSAWRHVQKKTAHAAEQQRPDVLKRRLEWFDEQPDLDPSKLVFIDETGASTNLARKGGRCRRGRRLRAAVPHGHYKTVTLVAGVSLRGLVAPKTFDRPINAALFEEWVENCLVPTLSQGDIVVMDMYGRPRWSKKNLSASAARSRVLTCIRPLMRRVTCRRPVWEFADRIQNNLARSRRLSMNWFFRPRLCDRCAILSVRSSYAVDNLALLTYTAKIGAR